MSNKINRRTLLGGALASGVLASNELNNGIKAGASAVDGGLYPSIVKSEYVGGAPSVPWTQDGGVTKNSKGELLMVTMPMSKNGLVNVVKIGAAPYDKNSKNIYSKVSFNDGVQRGCQCALTLPDGDVLIGTTDGKVVQYKVNAGGVVTYNLPANTSSMIWSMAVDKSNSNVFFGTRSPNYPNGSGHIVKASYSKGGLTNWRDLGVGEEGQKVVASVAAWSNTLFYSVGFTHAKLYSIDLNNNAKKVIEDITPPTVASTTTESFLNLQVFGDYLFAAYSGNDVKRRWLNYIYKLERSSSALTATFIRTMDVGWSFANGIKKNTIVYRGPYHHLWEFDYVNINNSPKPLNYSEINQMPRGGIPLDDSHYVAFGFNGELEIIPVGVEKSTILRAEGYENGVLTYSGDRDIAVISKSSNNSSIFLASSYFSPLMARYDGLAKTEFHPESGGGVVQVQGFTSVASKMVYATYPSGGNYAQTDLLGNKPTKFEDAFKSVKRLNGLLRPGGVTDVGGGLAMISVYGAPGHPTGGYYLWDTQSARIIQSFMLPLSGHGAGMVAKAPAAFTEGWIYGVTNVAPPDNNWVSGMECHLWRWRPSDGAFESFPISKERTLSLEFAPNGLLYGIAANRFHVFNPGLNNHTFKEVSKTVATIGNRWSTPFGALTALDNNKMLVSAGFGTSYPGDLYMYNLMTNTYQNLNTKVQSRVYITKDKYWYYTVGADLLRQQHPEAGGEYRRIDNYNLSRQKLGL